MADDWQLSHCYIPNMDTMDIGGGDNGWPDLGKNQKIAYQKINPPI